MNILATSPNYVSTNDINRALAYIKHGKLSITQRLMLRDGRLDIDQMERQVLAREAAEMQERLGHGVALLMSSASEINEAFRLDGLDDQSVEEFHKDAVECLKGVACVSMKTTEASSNGLGFFSRRAWLLHTLARQFFSGVLVHMDCETFVSLHCCAPTRTLGEGGPWLNFVLEFQHEDHEKI